MQKIKKRLGIAARKWKRMLSQAVRASIFKTLTEPITNACDSYKKLGCLAPSSGIVDKLLSLDRGMRVEHDDLIKGIKPISRKRNILVRFARTKKAKLDKRQVQVIDNAEGMSFEDLSAAISKYGEDTSKQSKGAAVRALFGQGISDVLWGHERGSILSIKDGLTSACNVSFDSSGEPIYEPLSEGKATKATRKSLGINENGTCIQFTLSEKCHIPSRDQLYEKACSFYMVRLINADPCCDVILEQYTSKGIESEILKYNFPSGEVLKRFFTKLQYDTYDPVDVDGIIIRSDHSLDSDSDLEKRENGFLIIDEYDTVYDLTLFDFEKLPGLDQIYGIVRLKGFREIAYDKLHYQDEAIITESRDGLDQRNTFTKALWSAINPLIEATLKEEKRRKTEGDTQLSGDMKKRVDNALELLNSLYKDETGEEGTGPGDDGFKPPKFDDLLFFPNEITLTAGVPRRILLLAKSDTINPKSEVVVESKNSDIIIEPEEVSFGRAPQISPGILAVGFKLESTVLESSGAIIALTESKEGDSITTEMWVRDVRVPPELEPPEDGIEFRPKLASTIPARKGLVVLFIDVVKVPINSDILFRLEESPAGLSLISDTGSEISAFTKKIEESDIIKGTGIAKIPIRFRGHGKGQKGKLSAKVKVKHAGKYKDTAEIRITDSAESSVGMFKKIEYEQLPDSSKLASQFYAQDGTIYVNSKHPINVGFFGKTKQSFKDNVDSDRGARIRLAQLVLDEAMYHTLAKKQHLTGNKGWKPEPRDLVSSVREQIEIWKHDVGARLFMALVEDFNISRLE